MAATERMIDWDGMRPHFEAGIRTLRDLGVEYGCTPAAILKHANKQTPPWERNLKGRIKAKADAKVNAAAVNAKVNEPLTKARQAAVVDANATLQAGVRLSHRADIKRARGLTVSLLGELEKATAAANKAPKKPKKGEAPVKAIDLAQRAVIAKNLTEALRVQVGLERQAFGIDDRDPAAGNEDEFSERLINARQRAASR